MDRDHAREGLVRALLADRAVAARIRAELDSSQFGDHTALVMLVADHDLHDPDGPPLGSARRDAVAQHVHRLLDELTRHELRLRGRRSAADPRWLLAADANASLVALRSAPASVPTEAEPPVEEMLAAFAERRHGDGPPVPGPARPARRRRRTDVWPS